MRPTIWWGKHLRLTTTVFSVSVVWLLLALLSTAELFSSRLSGRILWFGHAVIKEVAKFEEGEGQ